MAMIIEEIQAIKDSVKTEVLQIAGVSYASRPVHDVRKPDPKPDPVSLNTLTGFVDFLHNSADAAKAFMVHVVSHAEIRLVGPLYGEFKQRDVFAIAHVDYLFKQSFQFGQYLDCESFIVAMMTLFDQSPQQQAVLALIGNITDENVQTHADDGVTQTVTARTGIAKRQEVAVPNPILLKPFRTFREIDQPASLFILRMKQGGPGEKPKAALFEADGGAWKLDAILAIRDYLISKSISLPVLA